MACTFTSACAAVSACGFQDPREHITCVFTAAFETFVIGTVQAVDGGAHMTVDGAVGVITGATAACDDGQTNAARLQCDWTIACDAASAACSKWQAEAAGVLGEA
ncbi:MAG: hypothetical protein K2X77_27370 [Candidatus Obscuribacterales bacterium]|nr:hypothetical protein [Candidatus Obscuribacterales bacterium]